MKKRTKVTIGIFFLLSIVSISSAGITQKIKEMCSKKIFDYELIITPPSSVGGKCTTGGTQQCDPCLLLFN